jgi:hypothetical protein
MDRGVFVILHQPLADEDGILEVAALPTQVGDDDILPQRQFTALGAGGIGQHIAALHHIALEDDGALVDAGALVGAVVFAQMIDATRAVLLLHDDLVADDADHFAVMFGRDDLAGIDGGLEFHAGADERRIRAHEGHGLALHVGTHERAVGVIVLQERNQRSGDATICLGDTSM